MTQLTCQMLCTLLPIFPMIKAWNTLEWSLVCSFHSSLTVDRLEKKHSSTNWCRVASLFEMKPHQINIFSLLPQILVLLTQGYQTSLGQFYFILFIFYFYKLSYLILSCKPNDLWQSTLWAYCKAELGRVSCKIRPPIMLQSIQKLERTQLDGHSSWKQDPAGPTSLTNMWCHSKMLANTVNREQKYPFLRPRDVC